jgi:hypothetical protein
VPRGNDAAPLQIVYLFGAGATQAEADHVGAATVNLLMRDNERLGNGISTAVLDRGGVAARPFRATDKGIDIEKLISLLGASTVKRHIELAERLRLLYFAEVRRRLIASRTIAEPRLATALLTMHNDLTLRRIERLTGLLTTNHDGLLQIAAQSVYGAIDLGFPFVSADFAKAASRTIPPLLQLHGSFTWTFGLPISVTRLRQNSRYAADTVWIPPTILKESKTYPFNRLVGLGYTLLAEACDVLRVVGSSLTQNDWNILSLLFSAQRHREMLGKSAFRIELIMSHDGGTRIEQECSYLAGLTPIGYLTDGDFALYKEDAALHDVDMANAFAYWLNKKITFHRQRNELGRAGRPLPASLVAIAGDI